MLRSTLFKLSSLLFLLYANSVYAAFSDIEFAPGQLGDAQWAYSACTSSSSTSCTIYSKNLTKMYPTYSSGLPTGYYVKFTYNSSTGKWTASVYDSNDSLKSSRNGDIVAAGTYTYNGVTKRYFMYMDTSYYGTVFSIDGNFNNGNGFTFTKVYHYADEDEMDNYGPASSSSPTPVYSSGITAAQSTKRSTKLSETNAQGGMIANIDILGGSNIVDVYQADAEHYLELSIVGNTNTVDIDQTQPTGTAPHYADVVIDGNRNTLDLLQTGSGSKTAFIDVDGDDNVVDVIQKDSGQHYLQLDLIGDDHSATIVQEGSGSHDATVELTNGGGAWDFNLNQKGTTDKEYSLPHDMSDGSTTSGTCYVAAGCSATIIQND